MNTNVENINVKASDLSENQKKILEILSDDTVERENIYQEVRKEKQKEYKKLLIKTFGELPIFFLILLSSLSLTLNTLFYLILVDDFKFKIYEKFNYIEPFYTILIVCMSIGLFFIYLSLFVFSLFLYKKYLELSKNDNIDKEVKK